ncbi:gametogenetin [Heteronotia binoei]|uniref:gametogenetin n=1 Tax=Heteronotia binoei TaxID=13085 RepID=UPI0029302D59|nr:gametogenetin [Heteronotia binoei]
MGNVQSEATQESETTKDGEEKANPDRSKADRGASGAKRDMGCQSPSPQTVDLKDSSQSRGNEPGGGDRQSGAAEMGKGNSKKSKLKLSSMWAQNLSSSGIKEANLCNKGLATERRGLTCLSRADLQSGQNAGPVLPEEQKGLKAALKSPQRVAHDPRDLVTRKAAAKGKSKAENTSPGLSLQPERLVELGPGPAIATDEDAVETKVCWTQHIKPNPKEYSENEGQSPNSAPYPRKQLASSLHGPAPLNMNEDTSSPPKFLSERNTNRPAPPCGAAAPGGKKVLLSWASGHREKEQVDERDSAPGSDGDSKGPALVSQLPAEHATTSSSPLERRPASGSDAKAGGKNEAAGAEAVSSETMQELLERGLNFLYKVTIQPGQWPPSIKAVKQKAGLVPPSVSYADVLKQCPQKKAPASVPALPKGLHHLMTTGRKLPSIKGLENSNPEDFSSLSHLFLEHFKKVTPKEPASHVPNQQVVTFLEELSTANPKRPEWQRPRPPTPYPQRRKSQGRKLPKFGTAMSQVVAFLGSDSKCDWFVHNENQMSLDEAAMVVEEEGGDPLEPSSAVDQGAEEAGSSPSVTAYFLDEEIPMEFDENIQISPRKPPGLLEGVTGTVLLKSPPCNSAQGIFSPLATAWAPQTEDQPSVPAPKSPSPSETSEVSSPTVCTPYAPVGPVPEQKAQATAQARPKVRKQGPVAPKSKEKLKSSGQPKVKAPKGKGQKQWPRSCGVTSPLRLEGVPLFVPFEKVMRPFYFGEPSEAPLSQDNPAAAKEDVTTDRDVPEQDPEDCRPAERRRWPAFQVVDSCPRKCYCRHQEERKLPKNVVAWLNPSANHLAEPPWVATALLAVSLVAGTKFCQDTYKQQHVAHQD